jgi:hypothetical protein
MISSWMAKMEFEVWKGRRAIKRWENLSFSSIYCSKFSHHKRRWNWIKVWWEKFSCFMSQNI